MIAVISANSELMKLAILVSTSNTLSPPFYVYSVLYFGDLSREISKKIGFCTHFLGAFFVGEIEKGLTVVSPLLENRLSNYIP